MKNLFNRIFGIVTISDTFTPKEGRTEKQIYYDAYLKLQNEAIAKGVVKIKHLENGRVKVTSKWLR